MKHTLPFLQSLSLFLSLSLFVLASFFAPASHAQITIPESVFTDMFGMPLATTSYELATSAQVEALAAASGANQTWDFSAITVTDTFSTVLTYINLPAEIPGSMMSEFANATVVQHVMDDTLQLYTYYSIESGQLIEYGSVSTGDFDDDGVLDEFVQFNSPPSVQEVFPLVFENTWTDSTSTSFGGIPTNIQLNETTVDGWGTLITPQGSFDALREVSVDRSYNPLLPVIIYTTFTNIDFITTAGVTAHISLDGNGNVIVAEYSVSGEMTGTSIDVLEGETPAAFHLKQNYPNPFNPATQISFALPEASEVRLTVYDLLGKEVAALAEGPRAAGTYEVRFDAGHLPSGVYLYRLEAGSFTETRVMNLVK